MYSWEIDNYIKSKNYTLTNKEYSEITDTNHNPQVIRQKYNPCDNNFLLETNDNYNWIITISK